MQEEKYDIKKFLLIKKVYMKALSNNGKDDLNSGFAVFAEALDEHHFTSQQELSNFIGCNKAHTSRTLFKMQIKGLIKPCCKAITLTDKGKAFAESARKTKNQLKEKLFENISNEEATTFFKVLDKIILNAKAIEEK